MLRSLRDGEFVAPLLIEAPDVGISCGSSGEPDKGVDMVGLKHLECGNGGSRSVLEICRADIDDKMLRSHRAEKLC